VIFDVVADRRVVRRAHLGREQDGRLDCSAVFEGALVEAPSMEDDERRSEVRFQLDLLLGLAEESAFVVEVEALLMPRDDLVCGLVRLCEQDGPTTVRIPPPPLVGPSDRPRARGLGGLRAKSMLIALRCDRRRFARLALAVGRRFAGPP
jgi:hypothetical protein